MCTLIQVGLWDLFINNSLIFVCMIMSEMIRIFEYMDYTAWQMYM